MKTLPILAAGALALGLLTPASAQTVVKFTGSTAFRTQTITAILTILGGTGTGAATLPAGSRYGYNGTSRTGANFLVAEGVYQGNPIIVKMSFGGSNGGIQTTAGSLPVPYHITSPAFLATLTQGGTQNLPTPTSDPSAFANEIPDVAMMDTDQSATPFNETFLGVNYTTLTATRVGVIPYKWIATGNAPAGMTTMTPLLAQAQWTGQGTLPLALYTGAAADRATLVYATGRNGDSGTRNAAFTESGIGATAGVQQFDPATGNLYPQATLNGIVYEAGNGGESSGGTVASKMRNAPNNRVYVSYVGLNDANTATGATTPQNPGTPCKELAWNGVLYSPERVIDGLYTFWTYQNLGYRESYTGPGKAFADAVAAQIVNETSPILLNQMQVTRLADGELVTPLYGE